MRLACFVRSAGRLKVSSQLTISSMYFGILKTLVPLKSVYVLILRVSQAIVLAFTYNLRCERV